MFAGYDLARVRELGGSPTVWRDRSQTDRVLARRKGVAAL